MIYTLCSRQAILLEVWKGGIRRKWISQEEVGRERGREMNRERKFSISYLLCLSIFWGLFTPLFGVIESSFRVK